MRKKALQPMSQSTSALVIWGHYLPSHVGTGKLTKQVSGMIKLTHFQKSVIIGLILSDGWLRFVSKTHKNALLGFKQSLAHSDYIWFVFSILSHYNNTTPRLKRAIAEGKQFYSLAFETGSLPCFTELYSLFYPSGVKVIPNNIYELLTPVALAHVIMGDGSRQRHGLILCTDSYSVSDIVRLINELKQFIY